MSTVKPIPDTSSPLIPMLVCRDVAAEIDFCKTALGAVELGRRPGPDGAAAHALMTISGAMFIIEADGPEEAKTIASHHPAAHLGEHIGWGIEIRPIDWFHEAPR